MLEYYVKNVQFYIILSVWLVVGMYAGPAIFVVLPFTLFLMRNKGMWEELLIGFFFILILSDSLVPALHFAKNIKIVYLVVLAGFVVLDFEEFAPLNNLYRVFIPFFLIAILCLFFSPSLFIGFQKTFSYILMVVLIPTFMSKFYRDGKEFVFRSIIYFGVTILLAGFVLYFVKRDYAYIALIHRFTGVFGNPNGLGLFAFLLFTLFFTLNDIFEDLFSNRQKIFIYSVIVFSVFLSNSRNAILSVVILVVFEKIFKKSSFLGFIFSVILFFINILISDYIPILIKEFGLESFFRLNTLQELSGRAIAWQFAWAKIQNNFFIGRGFGYDEFTMRANYHLLSKLGTQGGVHSSYLSLWMDFGLVGLLIYFRSFFLVFIRAIKLNRLAFSIMYAVLFSAAFEGLFIGSLNPQMIILLMIITLLNDSDFYEREQELPQLVVATK